MSNKLNRINYGNTPSTIANVLETAVLSDHRVLRSVAHHSFDVWAVSFCSRRLSSLSCINEYLDVSGVGNVSEYSSRRNHQSSCSKYIPEKSS